MTAEDRLRRDLRIACEVLADLVRAEYPADVTLEEIASRFGTSPTAQKLAALRRVIAILNFPNNNVEGGHHSI